MSIYKHLYDLIREMNNYAVQRSQQTECKFITLSDNK